MRVAAAEAIIAEETGGNTISVIVMVVLGGIVCVGLTFGVPVVRYLREHSKSSAAPLEQGSLARKKCRLGLALEEEDIDAAAGPTTERP